MSDNRTYIRLICNKLFKDNLIFFLVNKIVKFYYTLYSHPLKRLKFNGEIPLRNMRDIQPNIFQSVNTETNILG